MTRTPGRVITLLAIILLLAVACGSDTESAAGPASEQPTASPEPIAPDDPPPTPMPEPTPEPTATPEPEPTATPEPTSRRAAIPATFFDPGPYAVGVTTISLADRDVEVWYPVDPAAAVGLDTEEFDTFSVFPEALQPLIPPELSGVVDTQAYRDLEPAEGTFPLLVYGHGFGGYRQVATFHTTHVASHGFVVASADHLERGIVEQTLDLLGQGSFDETNTRPDAAVQDVADTIAAVGAMPQLADRVDLDRIAVTGHSAGAGQAVRAAIALTDQIDTWVSVSGGAPSEGPLTAPGLVILGELDQVVPAEHSYELFEVAAGPVRLVNIADGGHNSFTDVCRGILDLGGIGSLSALLGEAQVARAEDGCVDRFVRPELAQGVMNHTTVAHLFEQFGGADTAGAFDRAVLDSLAVLADLRERSG